jgi:hypothetical protein
MRRYRTTYHKSNEDVREEPGVADTDYQKKWLEHLERMPENRISKLLYKYKPKEDTSGVRQNFTNNLCVYSLPEVRSRRLDSFNPAPDLMHGNVRDTAREGVICAFRALLNLKLMYCGQKSVVAK